MDPVSIARAAQDAANNAYSVGQVVFELWQGMSAEAGSEYETFSRDLNQLGHYYATLRPLLEGPWCVFSEHILRPLHRITRDILVILGGLRYALDRFRDDMGRDEKVIGIKLFRIISSPENERRKRLQRFLQRRRIVLQRSQVRYATSILNLVNAVVQHAQTRDFGRDQPRQFNIEDALLRDVHRAKRTVQGLEQRPEGWPVAATCWIPAVPSQPDGHKSPLDILADHWTTPESRQPRRGNQDSESIRVIRDLQRINAEHQQQISRLEHELIQYKKGYQEDAKTIARLLAEHEKLHRARERQDRANTAVMSRLQADIADIRRQHEAQGVELQGLKERCARLTAATDARKKDYESLRRHVAGVERERDWKRKQLEELERKALPPVSFRPPRTERTHRRSSGSSVSSQTYVEILDDLDHGNLRSDNSRGSSRGRPSRRLPDDREESLSEDGREDSTYRRRLHSRYGGRESSRNSREVTPGYDRRRDSREGRPADEPGHKEDDAPFHRQTFHVRQGSQRVDGRASRLAFR